LGHSAGGFRLWWRQLTGSDQTLLTRDSQILGDEDQIAEVATRVIVVERACQQDASPVGRIKDDVVRYMGCVGRSSCSWSFCPRLAFSNLFHPVVKSCSRSTVQYATALRGKVVQGQI
jgi:hypothetical protein